MTPSTVAPTDSDRRKGLEPLLGLRDLVFFYLCAIFGIRRIPLAESIGPGVVAVWCLAMLVLYVPQALTVIDLSTRFPGEGGIYLWSKEAFGEFHAFITAWSRATASSTTPCSARWPATC